jgi:hypothetical protein
MVGGLEGLGEEMKKIRPILFAFVLGGLVFFLYSARTYDRGADASMTRPRKGEQTLFVALDGVPYGMVEELFSEHKLRSFQKPSRVISTFPSTTTTGFTGLFRSLGARPSPGYDAQFYSFDKGEVRGNLLEAYDFEAADYNHFFGYNRNTGFQQVVMYTSPQFALNQDLKKIRPLIWDHPEKQSVFFYLGSTDGAGHLDGSDKTRDLLLQTLRELENLREEYRMNFKKDLRVVIFSDHGFHWTRLKKIDVADFEEHLKAEGLKLVKKMKNSKDVVAITWGNISGGDLYTSEESSPEVANLLLEMPGVDLVFYRQKDRVVVLGSRARTEKGEIFFDESGKRFGYKALDGDPLQYGPILEALQQEGKLDSEGMADEKDWFEKTEALPYPDALYRIHDAYFGLVQNPATILLSTNEDYEFGDNLTRWGSAIRGGMVGTHGAIALDSSSAFIASTDPKLGLPPVLRYDQALLPFKELLKDFPSSINLSFNKKTTVEP